MAASSYCRREYKAYSALFLDGIPHCRLTRVKKQLVFFAFRGVGPNGVCSGLLHSVNQRANLTDARMISLENTVIVDALQLSIHADIQRTQNNRNSPSGLLAGPQSLDVWRWDPHNLA